MSERDQMRRIFGFNPPTRYFEKERYAMADKIDTSKEAVEKAERYLMMRIELDKTLKNIIGVMSLTEVFDTLRALSAERDTSFSAGVEAATKAITAKMPPKPHNTEHGFAASRESGYRAGLEQALIAIRTLAPATSPVEDLAWKCACGWSGSHHQMNANEAGIRVCPKCGASGGLASDGPLHPPTSRERDDEWAKAFAVYFIGRGRYFASCGPEFSDPEIDIDREIAAFTAQCKGKEG